MALKKTSSFSRLSHGGGSAATCCSGARPAPCSQAKSAAGEAAISPAASAPARPRGAASAAASPAGKGGGLGQGGARGAGGWQGIPAVPPEAAAGQCCEACPSACRSRTPSPLFLETCKTGRLQVLGNALKAVNEFMGSLRAEGGKCL